MAKMVKSSWSEGPNFPAKQPKVCESREQVTKPLLLVSLGMLVISALRNGSLKRHKDGIKHE